jgi:hypothetical protein
MCCVIATNLWLITSTTHTFNYWMFAFISLRVLLSTLRPAMPRTRNSSSTRETHGRGFKPSNTNIFLFHTAVYTVCVKPHVRCARLIFITRVLLLSRVIATITRPSLIPLNNLAAHHPRYTHNAGSQLPRRAAPWFQCSSPSSVHVAVFPEVVARRLRQQNCHTTDQLYNTHCPYHPLRRE